MSFALYFAFLVQCAKIWYICWVTVISVPITAVTVILYLGIEIHLSVLSTFIFQFEQNSASRISTQCCWVFLSFMKIGTWKTKLFVAYVNEITFTYVARKYTAFGHNECLGKLFVGHDGVHKNALVNSMCIMMKWTICSCVLCDHAENEYSLSQACCKGELQKLALQWKQNTYAVGVVMASRGYPESSSKGNVITGKRKCHINHAVYFQAVALGQCFSFLLSISSHQYSMIILLVSMLHIHNTWQPHRRTWVQIFQLNNI